MGSPTRHLDFQLQRSDGSTSPYRFEAEHLVIAGWAARDQAAVRHHVDELAALGVPRPSTTPLFYRAATALLTQAPTIEVLGPDSSGEAEPLLLTTLEGPLVGLASDHTDRAAETWSVAHSKQICAKPVAPILWRFAEVEPHWDSLILRAWIPDGDGGWVPYQEGPVSSLRRPDELAALAGDLPARTAMLCGTLGTIGGVRPAVGFRMELQDPTLGRSITHAYAVEPLPIVT
ncbi:DUF2848 domain-containing protein [uncultured Methylobacterium sp.]|uniref:DUF2848 domain-containing protein n=1 Tax=uncultured Methylobacterium sp. TaxID=157278 RepID=UPI0035CBA43D